MRNLFILLTTIVTLSVTSISTAQAQMNSATDVECDLLLNWERVPLEKSLAQQGAFFTAEIPQSYKIRIQIGNTGFFVLTVRQSDGSLITKDTDLSNVQLSLETDFGDRLDLMCVYLPVLSRDI